jgi:hypothetical protein
MIVFSPVTTCVPLREPTPPSLTVIILYIDMCVYKKINLMLGMSGGKVGAPSCSPVFSSRNKEGPAERSSRINP